MTVRQLEQQLTSSELTEWQAYYRLNPFGSYRSDLQTASILRQNYSGEDETTLDDFLLFDPNPRTEEQIEKEESEALKQRQLETKTTLQSFFKSKLEQQNKN